MFKIEYIKVKDKTEDSNSSARKFLKKKGKFRKLDSGAFSSVYGNNTSKRVYKLGSDDTGYLSYLKILSRRRKHNPFTPKIYSVVVFVDDEEEECFVVEMEKLTPLARRQRRKLVSWFELLFGKGDWFDVMETLNIKFPPLLKQAVKLVKIAANVRGSVYDIHDGNFMLRGKKQLVLTDPLA